MYVTLAQQTRFEHVIRVRYERRFTRLHPSACSERTSECATSRFVSREETSEIFFRGGVGSRAQDDHKSLNSATDAVTLLVAICGISKLRVQVRKNNETTRLF